MLVKFPLLITDSFCITAALVVDLRSFRWKTTTSLPLRRHRHDCDEEEVEECLFARKLLVAARISEKS